MEARWQQQTAKHEGTETRARSQGSNPRLDSFWFLNPMITLAAAAAAAADPHSYKAHQDSLKNGI
jgi:hypothetical protein